MAEYASKAVGGTALGLSIGALAGELLSGGLSGILTGINGGNGCCSDDHCVNRYEAGKDAQIAKLETEIKLRDANTYTLGEMGKLREYVDRRFDCVNNSINQQAAINAQVTANLTCMQGSINTLMGLTKTVVPIDSICPEPMKLYNSWAAPTTTT